jgi:hypothetical protein
MLILVVPSVDLFDETKQEFITKSEVTLKLEHSLVSLSKWEQKHERPFLSGRKQTTDEILSYVKAMTITPNVPEEVYQRLSAENITDINDYIDAKMTATWFSDSSGAPQTRDTITNELIYYWMITFQIPFECEKWHLNRLFTLIRVCNIKQAKPKKMTRSEIAARNRELNARRKKEMGTTG